MRTLAMLVTMAVALSPAHAAPMVHLEVHVAEQHTSVEKDDGAPAGWGARWELAAGVALTSWLSVWGVTAASSYGDSQLFCGVNRIRYNLHVDDSWLGARVLFHPHRQLFLGLGYMAISTTEDSDTAGSDRFDSTSWELIVGANVVETRYATVQALLTAGNYDRLGQLEHVHFYSLGAGVHF